MRCGKMVKFCGIWEKKADFQFSEFNLRKMDYFCDFFPEITDFIKFQINDLYAFDHRKSKL